MATAAGAIEEDPAEKWAGLFTPWDASQETAAEDTSSGKNLRCSARSRQPAAAPARELGRHVLAVERRGRPRSIRSMRCRATRWRKSSPATKVGFEPEGAPGGRRAVERGQIQPRSVVRVIARHRARARVLAPCACATAAGLRDRTPARCCDGGRVRVFTTMASPIRGGRPFIRLRLVTSRGPPVPHSRSPRAHRGLGSKASVSIDAMD